MSKQHFGEDEIASKLFDCLEEKEYTAFVCLVEEAGKNGLQSQLNWDYICYDYCNYGGKVEDKSAKKKTPLMFSIFNMWNNVDNKNEGQDHLRMVSSLFEAGCNVNDILIKLSDYHMPESCMYWTPLLYAIEKQWWEMIELLMNKFDVDPNIIHYREPFSDNNYGPRCFYPIHYLLSLYFLQRHAGIDSETIRLGRPAPQSYETQILKILKLFVNDNNKHKFDWNKFINYQFYDINHKTTILNNILTQSEIDYDPNNIRDYLFHTQENDNDKIKLHIASYTVLLSENSRNFFENEENKRKYLSQYNDDTHVKFEQIVNTIKFLNETDSKIRKETMKDVNTLKKYIGTFDNENSKNKYDFGYLNNCWFKQALTNGDIESVRFLLPKMVSCLFIRPGTIHTHVYIKNLFFLFCVCLLHNNRISLLLKI